MRFYVFLSTFILLLLASLLPLSAIENNEGSESSINEISDRLGGLDERLTEFSNDVISLKKLKVSGYMQIQFEKTEFGKGFDLGSSNYSINPYDSSGGFVQSRFKVRRGRVKFTYDAGITQFVLQGDFTNEKFSLKDAYINVTEPWLKYISLTAGVFNRPNYEVEYSSSQRESMERSKVIRTLYPDERDLGAMLTLTPDDLFKLQIAGFNNTYQGDLKQFYPNNDNEPLYFMGRLTKEFLFMDLGLGVDFGIHARYGAMQANNNKIINSENNNSIIDSTSIQKGDAIPRAWYGVEAQVYYDFLGGMKIVGEYIFGSNTDEQKAASAKVSAIRKRDFSGYYVMLVKNIFTDWQLAFKYDAYNPNIKIAESDINDVKDLSVSTIGIGIHNYTFDNIRISIWYDINQTATSKNLVNGKALLAADPVDNFLTFRIQYKF